MDLLHSLLAVLCGALVGFTLGLIGGGGSIMATPLLLYVVGLQPHMAIGTGAVAVSANAFGPRSSRGWGRSRRRQVRPRAASPSPGSAPKEPFRSSGLAPAPSSMTISAPSTR